MALRSRVFGWSPPENEEFVDIDVASSRMLALQNPTFHISDPNFVGRPRRVASSNFESTSPESSTSALSSDEDSPPDKRAEESGRHADPAWVARPRNEFILFRCDYVRKHSREGKRIRRPPGAEAEKTLSKQAAEAWHHLPPEERLYWKERADGERNEHARRHPDYRYRPKKSATSRRRLTRSAPTKAVVLTSQEKEPNAATTIASRPESTSPSIGSRSSTEGMSTTGMATPRRYSSVPDFTGTDPVHRRLRSTLSQGWTSADRLSFGSPSRDVSNLIFPTNELLTKTRSSHQFLQSCRILYLSRRLNSYPRNIRRRRIGSHRVGCYSPPHSITGTSQSRQCSRHNQ